MPIAHRLRLPPTHALALALALIFSLFLLPLPNTAIASDNQFSPGVYAHLPSAKQQVEEFLDCHSTAADRAVDRLSHELTRQLFGTKTRRIPVILPGWFDGFTDGKYSQAFRSLISGMSVRDIKQMYNQIMSQARAAPKISKLLFLMEENDQSSVPCKISYMDMHKRVADQYEIAMAWLGLVNLYIDINNDYRAFRRQENQLNDRLTRYQRTRQRLEAIENYR